MIRVLFVDDEPALLEGLENRLRHLRAKWKMHFAQGPEEALVKVRDTALDVIVSDMRMPRMDGATLLQQVRKTHPHLVRIVLSGQTKKEGLLKALPVAHQFLSKPCDATDLQKAIERAFALQGQLQHEAVQRVIGELGTLPALPRLYWELTRALELDEVDLGHVARIIEQDIAMSARILQMVNSAFFRRGKPLTDVRDAVTHLGVNAIRSLVLSVELFKALPSSSENGRALEELQQHSLLVARIAVELVSDPEQAKLAFSAAMLHDIGSLIITASLPAHFEEAATHAKKECVAMYEAESKTLGFNHCELGAQLLAAWGLPYPLVEAILHHHQPSRTGSTAFEPVGAVHVANFLAQHHDSPLEATQNVDYLDQAYLEATRTDTELQRWKSIASSIAIKE